MVRAAFGHPAPRIPAGAQATGRSIRGLRCCCHRAARPLPLTPVPTPGSKQARRYKCAFRARSLVATAFSDLQDDVFLP
ncbi:hypothetical protein MTO96_020104 [Rhipicephalus appendiculatus]